MELGASSVRELLDDLPAQIQADVKRHLSRQATYSVDITKVSPLDPKRQQMAFLLLRWSMLFMLLHEVGHIVHGHVDYARRELHAVEYREAGGSPDVVLRRAQEQQADIFATTLMHFAVLRHPRELHPDLFGGKTEECIRALAFALVTVFSTIAVAEGSIPHEQRTHPDPRERFVAAITIGLEESRLEGIIASSDILQIGFEALFDVESLFREAFTKSTNPWRLDDDGIGVPLGLASTAETREQWRHWAKYDRYEAARRRKAGISWQIRL
jgi:hypothetical protein